MGKVYCPKCGRDHSVSIFQEELLKQGLIDRKCLCGHMITDEELK